MSRPLPPVVPTPPAGVALPRELVLASAGSGKTFRISSRIIGLLAHGQPVDSILGATFTRKAAGEILGRVLARLAAGARDDAAAAELAREITFGAADAAATAPLDAEACLALLTSLLRQLHRVSVGTLDAFFMRTAGVLGHELGLPPAWGVADEATAERLRTEALRAVLEADDRGLTVELVRMIARKKQASRAVTATLLRSVAGLYELHRQARGVAGAWKEDPRDYDVGEPPDDVVVMSLADGIDVLPRPQKRVDAWDKCLNKAAAALRTKDWEGFLCNTLVQSITCGDCTYYRGPIPDEIIDGLEPGMEAARAALGRELALQAGAMRRLVQRFEDELIRVQRRQGGYGFDDVTHLLAAARAGGRTDLAYRLDMRLRNVLLDEFQDTSVPQWHALRPLLEPVLERPPEESAVIVVADGKQSIYGWRGASPTLLEGIERAYDSFAEPRKLPESYRSSQHVLDVVNRVFQSLPDQEWPEPGDIGTVKRWRFEPQRAVHQDYAGYVRLVVGPNENVRGDHRPRLLKRGAELVAELQREVPGFTIGVLVRTNRAVARVIYELQALRVDASEEGGNPLTDSPAVAAVLALVRLADHPDDRIARYHVARSPVGAALAYADPDDDAAAYAVADRVRRRLLEEGYGRTLAWLAHELDGDCDGRDARRLEQLAEAGFRYDEHASLRPMDFVRVVENERVEDPSSAKVRVMTLHQSKGLEFDTVVLPELDISIFKGGGKEALTLRPDPTGPITQIWPYIGKELLPHFPRALDAADQARAAVLRDALSALYVGMTRARHALHFVLKADPAKPSTAFTSARILRAGLGDAVPELLGEGEEFDLAGDRDWHVRERARREGLASVAPAAPVTASAATPTPLLRTGGPRRRMLPRRTPSSLEGGSKIDLRFALSLDRSAADRGTLVHAWCEQIDWIEDGIPDAATLGAVALREVPGMPAAEVVALAAEFERWLDVPDVRSVLARGRYAPGARCERERPFLRRDGDAVIHGKIDRLVLWGPDDTVTGAEVIDFKSDAVRGAEIAERIEHYRPQMEEYRKAVAAAYGLELSQVRATLVFLAAGVVEEVRADDDARA